MKTARDKYFRWLVEHRIEVLAVNVAVFLIVAVGAGRVPIDYTMEQFFPGWGPERERYDRYKQSFPKEDAQISVFWKDSRPAGIAVYRDLQQAARYFEEVGLLDVQWLGSVEVAEVVEVEGESVLHVHASWPSVGTMISTAATCGTRSRVYSRSTVHSIRATWRTT
jgi:predicted RND superfamily exporter protein